MEASGQRMAIIALRGRVRRGPRSALCNTIRQRGVSARVAIAVARPSGGAWREAGPKLPSARNTRRKPDPVALPIRQPRSKTRLHFLPIPIDLGDHVGRLGHVEVAGLQGLDGALGDPDRRKLRLVDALEALGI